MQGGTYSLEVFGTVGNAQVSTVVTFRLMDPCSGANITLLTSQITDDTYVLRDPAQPQAWVYDQVLTTDTLVDCGTITVEFYNDDVSQSPLDADLFLNTIEITPGQNQFEILQTQDVLKKGVYPIVMKAYFTNYSSNFEELKPAFTMTIIDPCDDPASFSPSAPVDQIYTITQNAFDYTVPDFVVSPDWCAIDYTYSVADPAGDAAITWTSASPLLFTFEQLDDLTLSGPISTVYTITVSATTGNVVPKTASADFTLTLKNPCIDPMFVTI